MSLDALSVPVRVVRGTVRFVSLKIPWHHLKSEPVIVSVRGIDVDLAPLPESSWTHKRWEQAQQAEKERRLLEWELGRSRRGESRSSFAGRFLEKIVDNLQIEISDVHVRFVEADGEHGVFGVICDSLSAFSVDERWERAYIAGGMEVRKHARVEGLGVYFDCVGAHPVQGTAGGDGTGGDGTKQLNSHSWLLAPLAADMRYFHRRGVLPEREIRARVDRIAASLTDDQLYALQTVHDRQVLYEMRIAVPAERPVCSVASDPRAWLQYAGVAVLAFVRARRRPYTWEYLGARRADRKEYVRCFKRLRREEWDNIRAREQPISAVQRTALEQTLRTIEHGYELEDIVLFRSLAEAELSVEAHIAKRGRGAGRSSVPTRTATAAIAGARDERVALGEEGPSTPAIVQGSDGSSDSQRAPVVLTAGTDSAELLPREVASPAREQQSWARWLVGSVVGGERRPTAASPPHSPGGGGIVSGGPGGAAAALEESALTSLAQWLSDDFVAVTRQAGASQSGGESAPESVQGTARSRESVVRARCEVGEMSVALGAGSTELCRVALSGVRVGVVRNSEHVQITSGICSLQGIDHRAAAARVFLRQREDAVDSGSSLPPWAAFLTESGESVAISVELPHSRAERIRLRVWSGSPIDVVMSDLLAELAEFFAPRASTVASGVRGAVARELEEWKVRAIGNVDGRFTVSERPPMDLAVHLSAPNFVFVHQSNRADLPVLTLAMGTVIVWQSGDPRVLDALRKSTVLEENKDVRQGAGARLTRLLPEDQHDVTGTRDGDGGVSPTTAAPIGAESAFQRYDVQVRQVCAHMEARLPRWCVLGGETPGGPPQQGTESSCPRVPVLLPLDADLYISRTLDTSIPGEGAASLVVDARLSALAIELRPAVCEALALLADRRQSASATSVAHRTRDGSVSTGGFAAAFSSGDRNVHGADGPEERCGVGDNDGGTEEGGADDDDESDDDDDFHSAASGGSSKTSGRRDEETASLFSVGSRSTLRRQQSVRSLWRDVRARRRSELASQQRAGISAVSSSSATASTASSPRGSDAGSVAESAVEYFSAQSGSGSESDDDSFVSADDGESFGGDDAISLGDENDALAVVQQDVRLAFLLGDVRINVYGPRVDGESGIPTDDEFCESSDELLVAGHLHGAQVEVVRRADGDTRAELGIGAVQITDATVPVSSGMSALVESRGAARAASPASYAPADTASAPLVRVEIKSNEYRGEHSVAIDVNALHLQWNYLTLHRASAMLQRARENALQRGGLSPPPLQGIYAVPGGSRRVDGAVDSSALQARLRASIFAESDVVSSSGGGEGSSPLPAVGAETSTVFALSVTIRELAVSLNVAEENLTLATCALENFALSCTARSGSFIDVDATLGNLLVRARVDGGEVPHGVELLGLRDGEEDSLLAVRVRQNLSAIERRARGCRTHARVRMSSVRAVYLHRVWMLIIDYIAGYGVVDVFNGPDSPGGELDGGSADVRVSLVESALLDLASHSAGRRAPRGSNRANGGLEAAAADTSSVPRDIPEAVVVEVFCRSPEVVLPRHAHAANVSCVVARPGDLSVHVDVTSACVDVVATAADMGLTCSGPLPSSSSARTSERIVPNGSLEVRYRGLRGALGDASPDRLRLRTEAMAWTLRPSTYDLVVECVTDNVLEDETAVSVSARTDRERAVWRLWARSDPQAPSNQTSEPAEAEREESVRAAGEVHGTMKCDVEWAEASLCLLTEDGRGVALARMEDLRIAVSSFSDGVLHVESSVRTISIDSSLPEVAPVFARLVGPMESAAAKPVSAEDSTLQARCAPDPRQLSVVCMFSRRARAVQVAINSLRVLVDPASVAEIVEFFVSPSASAGANAAERDSKPSRSSDGGSGAGNRAVRKSARVPKAAIRPERSFSLSLTLDNPQIWIPTDTSDSETHMVVVGARALTVLQHETAHGNDEAGGDVLETLTVRGSDAEVFLRGSSARGGALRTSLVDPFGFKVERSVGCDESVSLDAVFDGVSMRLSYGDIVQVRAVVSALQDKRLLAASEGRVRRRASPSAGIVPESARARCESGARARGDDERLREMQRARPTSVHAEVGKSRLTLINDAVGFNLPVLTLTVGGVRVDARAHEALHDVPSGFSVDVRAEVAMQYYNAQLVAWEPLVERWGFAVHVEATGRERARSGLSKVKARVSSRTRLDITVTDALLENLGRAYATVLREEGAKRSRRPPSASQHRGADGAADARAGIRFESVEMSPFWVRSFLAEPVFVHAVGARADAAPRASAGRATAELRGSGMEAPLRLVSLSRRGDGGADDAGARAEVDVHVVTDLQEYTTRVRFDESGGLAYCLFPVGEGSARPASVQGHPSLWLFAAVQMERGRRVLELYPTLSVRNDTQLPLEVAYIPTAAVDGGGSAGGNSGDGEEWDLCEAGDSSGDAPDRTGRAQLVSLGTLSPGCSAAVPVSASGSEGVRVRPSLAHAWSAPVTGSDLRSVSWVPCRARSGTGAQTICVGLTTVSLGKRAWVVHVSAPLRVVNELPTSAEILLRESVRGGDAAVSQVVPGGGSLSVHTLAFRSSVRMCVRTAGFKWSTPHAVLPGAGRHVALRLVDERRDTVHLELLLDVRQRGGTQVVTIQALRWIVNHTPFMLFFGHAGISRHEPYGGRMLAGVGARGVAPTRGDRAPLLASMERAVCVRMANTDWSAPVGFDAPGAAGCVQLVDRTPHGSSGQQHRRVFELALEVVSRPLLGRAARVLVVRPRYTIVNRFCHAIEIAQEGSVGDYSSSSSSGGGASENAGAVLRLDAGDEAAFHWHSGTLPLRVCMRVADGRAWRWSGAFRLDGVGDVPLRMLRAGDDNDALVLRVHLRAERSATYALVYDEPSPPFRLENATGIELIYFQKGAKRVGSLSPGSTVVFAWDLPEGQHVLCVGTNLRRDFDELAVDKVGNTFVMDLRREAGLEVHFDLTVSGPTRVVHARAVAAAPARGVGDAGGHGAAALAAAGGPASIREGKSELPDHRGAESEGPVAPDVVYERQRRPSTLSSFSAAHLLPMDTGGSFVGADGRARPHFEAEEAPADASLAWSGSWRVVRGAHTDAEGWEYAAAWGGADGAGVSWRAHPDVLSVVRRRMLVRDRVRRAAHEDSASGAEYETGRLPVDALSIEVSLAGLCISAVQCGEHEVALVTIGDVLARWSARGRTGEHEMDVSVAFLQVDAQIGEATFPVAVAPTVIDRERPVLQLVAIWQHRSDGLVLVPFVSLFLQEMEVQCDEAFLRALLRFFDAARRSLHSDIYASGVRHVTGARWCDDMAAALTDVRASPGNVPQEVAGAAYRTGARLGGRPAELPGAMSWREGAHVEDTARLYVGMLQIHPLRINVSFRRSGIQGEDFELMDVLGTLLDAAGSTFSNINRAPLTFNIFALQNAFLVPSVVTDLSREHYLQQLKQQILKLLGSVEILGNPVGLARSVGTGVFDFFYEPTRALLVRPGELHNALGRGTSSLVRNVLHGTSSAAHSITASLTKGLTALSMDEAYARERAREEASERVSSLGEGLLSGAARLGDGFVRGITGLVSAPLDGAARDGARGFFQGVGRGLLGAAVKPAVGLLDLANRTSEGVRNSSSTRPAWARQRAPRVVVRGRPLARVHDEQRAMGRRGARAPGSSA